MEFQFGIVIPVSQMLERKSLLKVSGVIICAVLVFFISKLLTSIFSPDPKHFVKKSSALYGPFSNVWRTRSASSQFTAIEGLITNQVRIGSNREAVTNHILATFNEPDLTVRKSKRIPFLDYYIITASTKNPLPYHQAVFVKYALHMDILTNVSLSFDAIAPN